MHIDDTEKYRERMLNISKNIFVQYATHKITFIDSSSRVLEGRT